MKQTICATDDSAILRQAVESVFFRNPDEALAAV